MCRHLIFLQVSLVCFWQLLISLSDQSDSPLFAWDTLIYSEANHYIYIHLLYCFGILSPVMFWINFRAGFFFVFLFFTILGLFLSCRSRSHISSRLACPFSQNSFLSIRLHLLRQFVRDHVAIQLI